MDFLQACRKLISFDSSPSQGTLGMALWLKEYCESKGLHVELHEESNLEPKQANILVRPTSTASPSEFLLQTHLDTRDPGTFTFWEKTSCNPYEAHIISDRIYGLGTADAKLDFLCKIEALTQLDLSKSSTQHALSPVVIGTFGEETGMAGALRFIRKNKINPKYALIGEPTDLKFNYASKGFAALEIQIPFSEEEISYRNEHDLKESTSTQSRFFNGVEAHSANPELGESAITKLFEYMKNLPDNCVIMNIEGGVNYNTVPANAFLEIDIVSLSNPTTLQRLLSLYNSFLDIQKDFNNYIDIDFSPQTPTLNVGLMKTFNNYIQILATCRIPPSVQQQTMDKWLQKIKSTCDTLQCHFQINDYKKPFQVSKDSEFLKACTEELHSIGLQPELMTLSSTNEASLFNRWGVECVCFGAGERAGNIHTPHESVQIQQLYQATEFYTRIIKRLCL